jgi:hypothetical protein
VFFGAGQTLLAEGIPWRVVLPEDDLNGIEVLLIFGSDRRPPAAVVNVPDLAGWSPPPASFLASHERLRRGFSSVAGEIFRAYFRWRWARRLGDRLGLASAYTQSPFFRLPPAAARSALLAALGEPPLPRVLAHTPVLAEAWTQKHPPTERDAPARQLHLVNYTGYPQAVTVCFEGAVQGQAVSPDAPAFEFHGDRLELNLDRSCISRWA